MKLTVAMRIVGGFSAILLLLLFLGGTSYYSLSGISDTTNQVNSISIPALENSATLQSEFVKMSKISLQAFYADEVKSSMLYLTVNPQILKQVPSNLSKPTFVSSAQT